MKRALVIHGDIYGFGGAEISAVRHISILLTQGMDITVLHAGGALDVERIRRWSGVTLDPTRVRFVQAWPFTRWPNLFRELVLLRYALVLRAARRIVHNFDLVIGSYGEVPIDTGAVPLIQTVHIPLFGYDRESLSYLGVVRTDPLYRLARVSYVMASRWIAGWRRELVEQGLIECNSHWTGRQVLRHYPRARPTTNHSGANTTLAAGDPAYLPHVARRSGVVMIGRVVPFKRIELGLTIVEGLRQRGHDLEFVLIGQGSGPYADEVTRLFADRPWAQWHSGLTRDALERLAAGYRWGLHCAKFEHYGLAPLELQRLGCVSFVHDSGGQTEVVDDARLRYCDVEDAVKKMDSVISDPALAQSLFDALPANVTRHTIDRHKKVFLSTLRSLGFAQSE